MGIYTVKLSREQDISIDFSVPDFIDNPAGLANSEAPTVSWRVFNVKQYNQPVVYASLEEARIDLWNQANYHLSQLNRYIRSLERNERLEIARGDRADLKEIAEYRALALAAYAKSWQVSLLLELVSQPSTEMHVLLDREFAAAF